MISLPPEAYIGASGYGGIHFTDPGGPGLAGKRSPK